MRKAIPTLVTIALAFHVGAHRSAAQSQAESVLEQRIESSLQVFKDQSGVIAEEKVPLLREIGKLEDENFTLREAVNEALRLTSENNASFDGLRNELEAQRTDAEFSDRFLREYLDGFESRIHVAEDQYYKDDLTKIRTTLDTGSLNLAARTKLYLEALEIGLARAEQLSGGRQFEGKAIGPDGVVKTGNISVLGPVAYFSSTDPDDDIAGVLQFHAGTIEPSIQALNASNSNAVFKYAQGDGDILPLDASMGAAISVETANIKITDHVARGGPVGFAILALGAIALVVSLIKLFDLARFRTVESRKLSDIIHDACQRDEAAALEKVKTVSGPVGEMLELGVRNVHANSVLLEELMLSVVLRRRPQVERYLSFLAITAAAAPLLGLLGTVVGMIRTFALITVFGTGDPRALSAGISEALVTTELGLMVAIPTLVLHGIFSRMIRGRFGDMERIAFEFVKTISLEESKEERK